MAILNMINLNFTIYCTKTENHKVECWQTMKISQCEIDRRVCAYCPECKNSIAIDINITPEQIEK